MLPASPLPPGHEPNHPLITVRDVAYEERRAIATMPVPAILVRI